MKRLMWVVCALLLAVGINAQTKVIEKSAKKVPGWMNTAVDDYLIVSVTASSLADGQSKVLQEITERIIQAVASNVSVSKENILSEVNTNGEIESSMLFNKYPRLNANFLFERHFSF